MRIAHLADTHLGCRQYGLQEREDDFYHVFQEAIERILAERPDCVVHSGDLFERSQPPIRALRVVQEAFGVLRDAGIPVYAVPGNHDIQLRRQAIPPHVLYDYLGLRLIGRKHPWFEQDGVFIGGIPYRSRIYRSELLEDLKRLGAEAKGFGRRVLVLHQAIETFLPYEFELAMSDLPLEFDYYAMGHIHKRISQEFGRGILAYPGSTEIWHMDELGASRREGKGLYLVDIERDGTELQRIDLPPRREFIEELIPAEHLVSALESLVTRIRGLSSKPVVRLNIAGVEEGGHALHERATGMLEELVLRLDVRMTGTGEQAEAMPDGSLDIRALIAEECGEDTALRDLALSLFEHLGRNELEEALQLAEHTLERYA